VHPSQVTGEDVVMGARFIVRVNREVAAGWWELMLDNWVRGTLPVDRDPAYAVVLGSRDHAPQDEVEMDAEAAEILRKWACKIAGWPSRPPFPITFERVKAKIGRRSQDRKRWTMPLWVTDEERARIVEAARRSGRPVSAYARDASLHLPEGAVLPPYSRNGDDTSDGDDVEPEADVAS
jgi:hypothetical protein